MHTKPTFVCVRGENYPEAKGPVGSNIGEGGTPDPGVLKRHCSRLKGLGQIPRILDETTVKRCTWVDDADREDRERINKRKREAQGLAEQRDHQGRIEPFFKKKT